MITKSIGTTQSERYLVQLCERSFLNLWSYPNIFRDESHGSGKPNGKEICDLLVVCGNHIIIFSEKTKGFPGTGNSDLDWRRWFTRAILDSAKQIRGAERWLTQYPERTFLDRKCSQRLPIDLPKPSVRHMHRVLVARGAAERCRQWFQGGSGSLYIVPGIKGKCHTDPQCAEYQPFAIGDIDPDDTFIHVLDDVSLDILMTELDTIADFVNYLDRKENFFRSGHLVFAAGEEELLAYYFRHIDESGSHNFIPPSGRAEWQPHEFVILEEGLWDSTRTNPQYVAKKEADEISYLWDGLITRFTKHMLAGTTLAYGGEFNVHEHEKGGVRFMALEPRFRRRILSKGIANAIKKAPPDQRFLSGMVPSPEESNAGTAYLYLQFPFIKSESFQDYEIYRELRINTLYGYCLALKCNHPYLERVIGIATEPLDYSRHSRFSEDLILVELEPWTKDLQRQADQLRQSLGILRNDTTQYMKFHSKEYPDEPAP